MGCTFACEGTSHGTLRIRCLIHNSNIIMKKIIRFVLVFLAIVAVSANAQTRKDKKAAEKAQWEQQQRQEAEISELRHQIRKANLSIEQAAMDAQADAQKKSEERAQQRAIEKAAQEVVVDIPCGEFLTTNEYLCALGIGEEYDQQMAIELARVAALEELASQINTSVQSLVSNYKKSLRINLTRESQLRMEGMTLTAVNQTTGYRIACRKTTSYILNGEKLFKQYMVLEVNTDDILEPIYEGIQEDEELKLEMDYQKFAEEFDKNCQQDMLTE